MPQQYIIINNSLKLNIKQKNVYLQMQQFIQNSCMENLQSEFYGVQNIIVEELKVDDHKNPRTNNN